MKRYINGININTDGNIKETDLAEVLRSIANYIESGYTNGLVGCSCISWNLDFSEDEYDEESEE